MINKIDPQEVVDLQKDESSTSWIKKSVYQKLLYFMHFIADLHNFCQNKKNSTLHCIFISHLNTFIYIYRKCVINAHMGIWSQPVDEHIKLYVHKHVTTLTKML